MRSITAITAKKTRACTCLAPHVCPEAHKILCKTELLPRYRFMWKDKRGNWHVLYHRMFDPAGPLDPNCERLTAVL